MDKFEHISVLLQDSVGGLLPKEGGVYVDGTLGGGGHTRAILDSCCCQVIAFDRDGAAIDNATKNLAEYGDRLTLIHDNFANFEHHVHRLGITKIDGVLLDLGVSSHQIDTKERGFSYMQEGPLDMRMNTSDKKTAKQLVNECSKEDLAKIFRDLGEEKFANRIAAAIEKRRQTEEIATTTQLVDIIKSSVPFCKNGHPAKKTFMALRIATNDELDILQKTLESFVRMLAVGGKMCVITFHSLEDRIVKQTLKDLASGCMCDKRLPICVCGKKPALRVEKIIRPSEHEIATNKRATSATLRIATKL
ncbi:MAG: 16S rRNA (cytosine(1402)-N(4))-methyltransferase RsmH [Firmicutes bacterium]|nr:16S rRNA (cytosine(1402)-N(4))-methyltransferase RsmH [Bacillota bacterium]